MTGTRRVLQAAALVAAAAMAATAAAPGVRAQPSWATVRKPSPGPARVIGFYTNGCLAGAEALPLKGPGFRVLRPRRNRYWGHPSMIAFIERLAGWARHAFGRPILVADIGQPRGGPISGHASHEIGLDADIRLALMRPDEITRAYIAKAPNIKMVVPGKDAIDRRHWSSRQVRLIRRAALDPAVDRLFVNPVIKRELCRVAGPNRAWLGKVVPWYGHVSHMHVRMLCPKGSPACRSQKPVPENDGCGKALTWWFEVGLPAARKWLKTHRLKKKKSGTPGRRIVRGLPRGCGAVIGAE